MTGRYSYKNLMSYPAWLLLGPTGRVVASIRAPNRREARRLFARHNLHGSQVVPAASYEHPFRHSAR